MIDRSTLRIREHYSHDKLRKYSYFWRDSTEHLLIGWDNTPHHTHLPNFPHHKRVGQQGQREPSDETSLEQARPIIRAQLRAAR